MSITIKNHNILRSPPVASLRDLSVAGPWPGAPVVSRADARQAQMEAAFWMG